MALGERPVNESAERLFSQELVLAIRDHIIVLVTGPLMVAFVAYLLTFNSPREYRSTAFLRIDAPTAKWLEDFVTSPPAADEILAKLGVGGTSPESRGQFMAKHFRVIAPQAGVDGNVIGLGRLDVDSPDPQVARSVANAAIESWLGSTRLVGASRTSVESELERHKLAATANSKLIDGLQSEFEVEIQNRVTKPSGGNSVSSDAPLLSTLISKRHENLASINVLTDRLRGITKDIVIVPPHLPQDPLPARAKAIALIYGLAAVPIFLALIVLGRFLAPGFHRYPTLARYFRKAG